MLNTTIQFRIDSKTKRAAQRKFRALGLDLSSAVKLLLRKAVVDEQFSIAPMTHAGLRPKRWKIYRREIEETLRSGKGYKTAREMHTDILLRDARR